MVANKDDVAALTRANEPVRKLVFTVLFVLMVIATAIIGPMFGLLGGLIFGFVAGAVLTAVYTLTTRSPKGINPAYTAGNTACPSCGSMQTDQTYTRGDDDGEVLQWKCYACDHHWHV